MTVEKLIKYCLQYLEQSSDTDVMEESIDDLKNDDEFSEYINNIEHSIYMGLTRYATSNILPICEYQFSGKNNAYITTNGLSSGKALFHEIKEIYAIDSSGNVINNIPYFIVGKKVQIVDYNSTLFYCVIYQPTIFTLDSYLEDNDVDRIYDLNLDNLVIGTHSLCIPDEMAINIKYLAYSDMKIEENPSMANYNKSYFENYLAEAQSSKVDNNQVVIKGIDWGDVYGN